MNEYLSALLRNSHVDSDATNREYDYFFKSRDHNKDGKLDRLEVKEIELKCTKLAKKHEQFFYDTGTKFSI